MNDSSQRKDLYNNLTIDGKSIDDIIKECTIDTINLNSTEASITDITTASGYNTSYSSGISSTYTPGTFATITLNSSSINTVSPTYTMGGDTITFNSNDQFAFEFDKEWHTCFPRWNRIQDMCEKYPGLKIAFDNFKVFYEMCKDDYDNPTPKK